MFQILWLSKEREKLILKGRAFEHPTKQSDGQMIISF